MNIVSEKIKLAHQLLEEADVDMWLLFVRETSIMADPSIELLVGHELTWESFVIFTKTGDAIILVGEGDQQNFEREDHFTEVLTHRENPKDEFLKLINRLDPKQIALNYSLDDPSTDGLTHGMYLTLCDFLKGTVYADRLISAAPIGAKLRSRKSATEIEILTRSHKVATDAWERVLPELKTGQTEIEVADIIEKHIRKLGGELSFATIVNAGAKTKPGHCDPTEAIVENGDLLHVDFGAVVDSYCSDIQRLVYFKKPNEESVPPELTKAFNCVRDIITATGKISQPGINGVELDSLARKILADNNYPEYPHALGHQLGRAVHDGGALIGPKWPRYGSTVTTPLEKNNVFTLELEINLDGIGCVGLEEDMIVTPDGAQFLGLRQEELTIK